MNIQKITYQEHDRLRGRAFLGGLLAGSTISFLAWGGIVAFVVWVI